MIEEIIRIARTKPDAEAKALIAAKLAQSQIGWLTTQDGKKIPLRVGVQ